MFKVPTLLSVMIMLADASPMRVLVGGPTRDTTTSSPPSRPTTAGKRVPSMYQHLLQDGELSQSWQDPQRTLEITQRPAVRPVKQKRLPVAMTDESSESSGHSSYQPTASEESDLSQSGKKSKKRKLSLDTITASITGKQQKSEDGAISDDKTPFEPKGTQRSNEPVPKTSASGNWVARHRVYSRNYYRRKAGQPEDPVPFPPPKYTPEYRRQRKERTDAIIEQHKERIEELIAQRDLAALTYLKLSKEERNHPEVKEQYEKQQKELQQELMSTRAKKNRIYQTESQARRRAKMRLEQGLPDRNVGRPRSNGATPSHMVAYSSEHIATKQVESKRTGPALGDIRWSGRERGARIQRQDISGMRVPVAPEYVNGRALLSRRPRLPPSADPQRERHRAMRRNRRATEAGRPLETLPPLPKHLKKKIA